jgi:hypothetical protein
VILILHYSTPTKWKAEKECFSQLFNWSTKDLEELGTSNKRRVQYDHTSFDYQSNMNK